MKRYIYITLIIIIVAVIAIGAIFLAKKSPSSILQSLNGSLPQVGIQNTEFGSSSNPSTPTNIISLQLSGTNNSSTFGIVVDAPVLDYFVDSQDKITTLGTDGTVAIVSNATTTTLSTSTINNIIYVEFSFDGRKILVNSGDPNNPNTSIFDVTTRSWLAAPQGMQSPQWSPSSYQIAYLSHSSAGTLSLSIIDASKMKKVGGPLLTLHAADLTLDWISKDEFSLKDKPTASNNGSLWMFNSKTGTFNPVAYEQAGVESIWEDTNAGMSGLVFRSNGNNLQLITGTTTNTLSFVTLPSKCVFGNGTSTYLFCGIPTDQSSFASANLPDDYLTMSLFTSDEIVRVNTVSGREDILWNNTMPDIDATDLKVFNNILFFINRYDHKLYALTLGS